MGGPAVARGVSRGLPYRYAILDRDSKFDADVIAFLEGDRSEAQANERPGALAKRGRGTMGGKLLAARSWTMSSR